MPFIETQPTRPCPICESVANVNSGPDVAGTVVSCSRCGDFQLLGNVDIGRELPIKDGLLYALASHLIRKMQTPGIVPELTAEFWASLRMRSLPTPSEQADNLVLLFAQWSNGQPGKQLVVQCADPRRLSEVGVVNGHDLNWLVRGLVSQQLLEGQMTLGLGGTFHGNLTFAGWERVEHLRNVQAASKFAFFARKFDNPELDTVFKICLFDAVKQTGFELRTVSQKAGHIDAIIEDEIRRCRFLIADLSDDNLGAYWEAGLAEGLGKPVIYICRAKEPDSDRDKITHFDTSHRQTIRWGEKPLDETAKELKAVIRNTLLGDAKQADD